LPINIRFSYKFVSELKKLIGLSAGEFFFAKFKKSLEQNLFCDYLCPTFLKGDFYAQNFIGTWAGSTASG
jgi:hypothetical protein